MDTRGDQTVKKMGCQRRDGTKINEGDSFTQESYGDGYNYNLVEYFEEGSTITVAYYLSLLERLRSDSFEECSPLPHKKFLFIMITHHFIPQNFFPFLG